MLFLVGNNKGNAHKKQKYTQKKCENANVVPLKKGTAKTKSAVPLEKEQQKRKCRSFGKGTAKWTVPFLWKRNSKNASAVPLEKEQQKHTCRSFEKGTTKMKSEKVQNNKS